MRMLKPVYALISVILTTSVAVIASQSAHAQTTSKDQGSGVRDRDQIPNAHRILRSTSISITQTSISLLYLADGAGRSATALAVPLYIIPGTANRLKICGIGAVGLGGSTQIYMGTALSYLLYNSKSGWSATAFAGWKGVSLTNGQLPSGAGNAVIGIGVSIPVRSL